jgi:hypothetical protein
VINHATALGFDPTSAGVQLLAGVSGSRLGITKIPWLVALVSGSIEGLCSTPMYKFIPASFNEATNAVSDLPKNTLIGKKLGSVQPEAFAFAN